MNVESWLLLENAVFAASDLNRRLHSLKFHQGVVVLLTVNFLSLLEKLLEGDFLWHV
jgi:hypothetical protein